MYHTSKNVLLSNTFLLYWQKKGWRMHILTCARVDVIKSWMFVFFETSMISSMVTFRSFTPYAMLSFIEQLNNIGSWVTIPICFRK